MCATVERTLHLSRIEYLDRTPCLYVRACAGHADDLNEAHFVLLVGGLALFSVGAVILLYSQHRGKKQIPAIVAANRQPVLPLTSLPLTSATIPCRSNVLRTPRSGPTAADVSNFILQAPTMYEEGVAAGEAQAARVAWMQRSGLLRAAERLREQKAALSAAREGAWLHL